MNPSETKAVAKILAGDSDLLRSRVEAFLKNGGGVRQLDALATEIASDKLCREWLQKGGRRMQASLLLMVAKLQGKEYMRDDSLIRAKLTARMFEQTGSFDFHAHLIEMATARNDKQFFVDLGRCLSREIKDSTLFDNRDRYVAEIVLFHPEMPVANALQELEKRGHHLTEASFKMRKMRLLKAKPLFDAVMAGMAGTV